MGDIEIIEAPPRMAAPPAASPPAASPPRLNRGLESFSDAEPQLMPSPLEMSPAPVKKAKKVKASSPFRKGQMDYLIPSEMVVNKPTKCTIRIAGEEVSKAEIKIGASSEHQAISITSEMGVKLIDVSGGEDFKIVPLSSEVQSIEQGSYTEWNFWVTPLKDEATTHTYILMLSVVAHYGKKKKDLPLIEKSISVAEAANKKKPTKRIVFMAADIRQDLNLDNEAKIIRDALENGNGNYQYTKVLDLTAFKLMDILLTEEPAILHYSGHSEIEGIFLFDEEQNPVLASTESIVQIFEANKKKLKLECLVLNSCFSAVQAAALNKYCRYVVGTTQAVPDNNALLFSKGFYQQLFAGQEYLDAYKASIAALQINVQDQTVAEMYKYLPLT